MLLHSLTIFMISDEKFAVFFSSFLCVIFPLGASRFPVGLWFQQFKYDISSVGFFFLSCFAFSELLEFVLLSLSLC